MTACSLLIRLLTVADTHAFAQLRLRACKEEPTAFLEAYEEIANLPEERFKKHFDNGWIAGAFLDGALVANAGLYRHKGLKLEHKGTVWGVYVAPEARGRGLARRLIELVMAEAEKAGIELVHLSTDASNSVSIALYKSLGFEEWGVDKHIMKVDGEYVDDLLMRKFLL